MENNIKHIIQNYQYFELDEAQKQLVSKWASNSDEFYALKRTFIATDAIGDVEVNPTIKQRLDVRFAEKHENQRLVWYNKLWIFLWPNDTQLYKRPLVQFAAICLIIIFTIPLLPNMEKQQLAMNEEKQEVKVEEKVTKDKTNYRKSNSAITEEIHQEEKEVDALAEISKEEVAEEPIPTVEKQSGWELVEDSDMSVAEEIVVTDFNDQRQKKSESSYDLDLEDSHAAQSQVHREYDSDIAELPIEEELSANINSKDKFVRKKVETKETIDLLTALY